VSLTVVNGVGNSLTLLADDEVEVGGVGAGRALGLVVSRENGASGDVVALVTGSALEDEPVLTGETAVSVSDSVLAAVAGVPSETLGVGSGGVGSGDGVLLQVV